MFCMAQRILLHHKQTIITITDAAVEKHVPVFEINNGIVNVTVGSVEHTMAEEHYIEWIAILTKKGCQRAVLNPEDAPKASFALTEGDEVLAVYAYCNLHSLWKACINPT